MSDKYDYEWTSSEEEKIVLTMEEKLEIINLLQKGTSYTVIKYGIWRSTVVDIKKSEPKFKAYKEQMIMMGVKTVKIKAMKMGSYK